MDNKKRKEEEKHYIDLYNSTNTNARGIAVDYFYFKHENYIKKLMGEFCPTYKVKYYDDLLSSGKVGIMEALQKFDPEKGRFTTWSKRYIIHEFLNFLCEIVFQCSVYYAKLQNKIRKVIKKLELELIPKDPNDNKNVIMEIRGAAGGDEGNIFAGDLYRMYVKYAESQGWKVEVMEAEESEAGGFSLISFNVIGDGVYGKLKYESGSHRVQRVPKTETQGRVHTSTATVLVMPEMEEVDVQINKSDLRIDTYRASGAGGQHINKTDSAVRITHLPTGIVATSQDGRSQHDNRDKAMKALVARVYDYFQSQQTEAIDSERKSKVGTGDRAEKIRTYNYPQNRVTDHRIGLTIQQLDRIIEGKLDDIITALINEDQRLKLEGQK